MKTLPDKPSELIRFALKDLEEVEQLPDFSISMLYWMDNQSDQATCYVCLAGAVMVRSLYETTERIDLPRYTAPGNFEHNVAAKLRALDYLRLGKIRAAFWELKLPDDPTLQDRFNVPPYNRDPDLFKVAMMDQARYLETMGH